MIFQDVSGLERRFGVCFIDTSLGVFQMAEFDDDKHCSKLLVCLSEYPPGLVCYCRLKYLMLINKLYTTRLIGLLLTVI